MPESEMRISDEKMRRRAAEEQLASDIIDECRVQLMMKFRFLDRALWRMNLDAVRSGLAYPLATDGARVAFDPPRVIARFSASFEESVRDYLHMVMHCIFRHPFDKNHNNLEAWNLTCDIIVENAVMDMCGGRFSAEDDSARREALSTIAMLAGSVVPSKVYTLVCGMVHTPDGQQYRGLGRSALNEWHALFERDEHAAWPAWAQTGRSEDGEQRPESVSRDDDNPDVSPESEVLAASGENEQPQEGKSSADADSDDASGSADDANDADNAEDASQGWIPEMNPEVDEGGSPSDHDERDWEDIAKQIEMNLETFAREWGDEAGSLMANLAVANRKTFDYTEFLRKFMVQTEQTRLNHDEFDYIYYTYGMDLYGDMPLVEPLEYKEDARIRDFVIAIDTSESVSGDLVKRFVVHTFGILKGSEHYDTDVNIHIVQCDTRVQSDIVVSDLREVDVLMESFTVGGFGGTDFRPVFDYVDDLRRRGELPDLKGLLFFTDGLGQFPERAPDYDTAFVFMDDGTARAPVVPPWAMKVVLDEFGINKLKSTGNAK